MKKLMMLVVSIGLAFELLACAAITKKGTQCKRAPSPGSLYCWQHGGTTKAQHLAGRTGVDIEKSRCKAITKAGAQCKRQADTGKEFCWQHAAMASIQKDETSLQRKSVVTKNASVESESESAKGLSSNERVQCDTLTKKGTRCTRKAQPGSTKCWQHQ